MSEWRRKRFWAEATAEAVEDGWIVTLDGRAVQTPAKAPLLLPTARLAQAIAAEWAAQEGEIDPFSMPVTRAANSAIDKVRPQRAQVVAGLVAYAETDLICHRAESPESLAQSQAEAWDPLLDWARSGLGAPLIATAGILPVAQPETSLTALHDRVAAEDAFALTALSELVSLSGSLVIGLAAVDAVLPVEELWRRSRIDETFQESRWGVDEEAAVAAAARREDFLRAARLYTISRR